MRVLAIDPGNVQSAFVLLDLAGDVEQHGKWENGRLADSLRMGRQLTPLNSRIDLPQHVVIEMVACYGMPVGKEVFDTVLWIGRFVEILTGRNREVDLVFRRDVKLSLCGQARAKDANIRQALIDLYGGSKEAAIGRKKTPGPLYGVSGDVWAALAVGMTWLRMRHGEAWEPTEATA